MELRPIRRFVLLLDDEQEVKVGDLIVKRDFGTDYLDYYVLSVGTNENCDFGSGDRVVLSDPNCGRKLRVDGVACRLVRVSDIIAVIERNEVR